MGGNGEQELDGRQMSGWEREKRSVSDVPMKRDDAIRLIKAS